MQSSVEHWIYSLELLFQVFSDALRILPCGNKVDGSPQGSSPLLASIIKWHSSYSEIFPQPRASASVDKSQRKHDRWKLHAGLIYSDLQMLEWADVGNPSAQHFSGGEHDDSWHMHSQKMKNSWKATRFVPAQRASLAPDCCCTAARGFFNLVSRNSTTWTMQCMWWSHVAHASALQRVSSVILAWARLTLRKTLGNQALVTRFWFRFVVLES